jgi:hypothetical protein
VTTDATAVTIFTPADSQNTGVHSVQISMKCVAPQQTMKAPKATNIHENGSSFRALHTR